MTYIVKQDYEIIGEREGKRFKASSTIKFYAECLAERAELDGYKVKIVECTLKHLYDNSEIWFKTTIYKSTNYEE